MEVGRNGTLVMDDCRMGGDWGSIWGENMDCMITRCHFTSTEDSGLNIWSRTGESITIYDCTFDGTYLYVFRSPHQWNVDWYLHVSKCHFSGPGSVLIVGWGTTDYYDYRTRFGPLLVPDGYVGGNTFSGEGSGVVAQHELAVELFGENSFEDGARMHAWYWTHVTATPEGGSAYRDTRVEQMNVPGGDFEPPFDIWATSDRSLEGGIQWFVDVTDDPGRAGTPERAWLALWSYYWSDHHRYLADIVSYDPTYLSVDIDHRTWPHPEDVIWSLVEDWPWEEYFG